MKEDVGSKTLTRFKGTYLYSGEEMKKLYLLKTEKHVDMYYNDVEALNATFQYFNNLKKYFEQMIEEQQSSKKVNQMLVKMQNFVE